MGYSLWGCLCFDLQIVEKQRRMVGGDITNLALIPHSHAEVVTSADDTYTNVY